MFDDVGDVRADGRDASSGGSGAWPVFVPPGALASGPLGVAQAADREIARQTAVRAVAAFAATRPASVDRPQGTRGAMSAERWAARPEVIREVSEWATPELMVAFSLTDRAAEALLIQSLTLVGRLPGTLAALEAGALHPGHLWCLLEHVAPIEKDKVRAEIETELLRWVTGRVKSPAQFAARVRREVARRDARAAVRKLERAARERGVFLSPGPVDGMATVGVMATLPEAQALYRTLQALVDTLEPDPADGRRTRGQKLVDVLLDLVLRPGECELPPVQVLLTVVASMGTLLGGDTPGEIDGHTVPAEMIRHLLATLTGWRPTPATPASDASAVPTPGEDAENPAADVTAPAGAAVDLFDGLEESVFERRLAAWLADVQPADFTRAAFVLDGYTPHAPARHDPADPGADAAGGPAGPDDLPGRGEAAAGQPADAADARVPVIAADVAEHRGGSASTGPEPDPDAPQDTSPGSDSPQDTPPDGGSSGAAPPADRGWWAAADRAVADAGALVQRAVEALGHATRLVDTARVADVADENAWRRSHAGRVDAAQTALEQLAAAGQEQRCWLAELLTRTGGGGLAERPRIALTDALSGTLLALSDLPGLRAAAHCGRPACRRRPERCGHDLTGRPRLGPPPPTDGYRPGAELDRFVRARDRRCRFPGCRRRVPKGGELDHDRRWPEGPTAAGNLTGYCTTNHRGKHQAPGWAYHLAPDGALTVTTPTGLTTTTEPPPF